jgi:glyoxylase-like metal-dependent hydrolase (beta-lactamase superfamily II)
MMKRALSVAIVVAFASPALAQEPAIDVEKLADNVYLFTYNVHRSLFVVTDDAILATDPQSVEAAPRYLEAIRKISQAPIRYLVYSHHHDDHVSGGSAFGNVTIVAHEAVLDHIRGDIVAPDITFADETSIYLDDLEVRLIYPGPSETESNIIVYVPERSVAFMVDAVSVRTVPWRDMADGDPHAWVAALEELDELDFEILAPGHGPTGTKQIVGEYIGYMTALIEAVEDAIDAGQTLEQMQASIELPQYRDWTRYDEHFDLNIEGVYRELTR